MSTDKCFHCGTDCDRESISFNKKVFCCNGCKTVYEILNTNELSYYYTFEKSPGAIPQKIKGRFDYLDNDKIVQSLISFKDHELTVINLYIPHIHCSSCIWILENLNKLNPGVHNALVDFPKKEARITFKHSIISLKQLAELLASIGYEPYISLEDGKAQKSKVNRKLIYQLAVAGFAFGNVMLLSFPEYFTLEEFWLDRYKPFFRSLMMALSIPALVYSSRDYFISAYQGLSKKILNIDVPIALGILVLFLRSTYEILANTGQGYFDSLTGLIFFLLLGKFFQQKTYSFLSFERDYKSYFPIAITKIEKDKTLSNIPVHDIEKGDRLLIRNEEIIPVDSILLKGNGLLDYSFVTGESMPVDKKSGDKLFAGGKQTGEAIEVEVLEAVSQSYLTQLWSKDVFTQNDEKNLQSLTDSISKHFTLIILSIALLAGLFWFFEDQKVAFQVVSAILIIACPCALALSAPFALGNMIRIFGKEKFYLKNTMVIETMSKINHLVFDKTGTITANDESDIYYEGQPLSTLELIKIKSLLKSSNHPLSRMLFSHLPEKPMLDVINFQEVLGKGISGNIEQSNIKLGSAQFLNHIDTDHTQTKILVSIDHELKGKFIFNNKYRKGLESIFQSLSKHYTLHILSGDNDGEKNNLRPLLTQDSQILFNQKPEDKLEFIKTLQHQNHKVMMLGDGLNDAGALAQSNVGVSVSENINVFSPACDGILDAQQFSALPQYLLLSKKTITIIKISFIISFMYNIIGLSFAITGNLSPVIAAVLMPVSSISVVAFVTIATNYLGKKYL